MQPNLFVLILTLFASLQNCVAQVGIEVSSLDAILHQFGDKDSGQLEEEAAQGMDYYCQKMLSSFFNYGESFVRDLTDPYDGHTEKIIPAKVFEQWRANFERKLKANPNFWRE